MNKQTFEQILKAQRQTELLQYKTIHRNMLEMLEELELRIHIRIQTNPHPDPNTATVTDYIQLQNNLRNDLKQIQQNLHDIITLLQLTPPPAP